MARSRMIALAVAVLLVGLATGVLGALVNRHRTVAVPTVPQDRPGPVLLVPGYGGDARGLLTLAAALVSAGRDAQILLLPGDGTGDLRVQAKALDAAARAALARTGAASVDVVGYSAGGVVARLWVRSYGGAGLARRVVTLGSPHHGTKLAGLASVFSPDSCPAACRQLAPHSDLLDALNHGDETPAGPEWVSVWSTSDGVVNPPNSSRLDGAVQVVLQRVCPAARTAHDELPKDPLVLAVVRLELAATPVVLPGPADCSRLR